MIRKGVLVKQKGSKIWYVVFRLDGKQKWISTGCANKVLAKEKMEAIIAPYNATDKAKALKAAAEEADKERIKTVTLKIKLNEMWPLFADSPERPDSSAETMRSYSYQFDRFRRWMEKNHPKLAHIGDVSQDIASDYARDLSKALSAGTYNKHRNLLKMVWKTLARKGKYIENPWLTLPLKRHVATSRRELSMAEVSRLVENATGELRTLVLIGIYTGLRLGDCATLLWEEIDMTKGLIHRIPNKTARKNRKMVNVPIHPALMDELRKRHNGGQHRTAAVLPRTSRQYTHSRSKLTYAIQQLFDAAGIARTEAEPSKATSKAAKGKPRRAAVKAGFHSLRHTFVSICRDADVPLAFVEAIVGHANPAMTRHYTHIGEQVAREAVNKIPALKDATSTLTTEESEAPVPPWIRERLESATPENWQTVIAGILSRVSQTD